MTPTDDGNKASYGTVADEELGELQTPSGSRRWPSRVALITIAMSLIVFATGIGTAKLRKGANFGGVGCTCGDYQAVFHGPTCCKCVESGSSTPSTDNPSGTCGSP